MWTLTRLVLRTMIAALAGAVLGGAQTVPARPANAQAALTSFRLGAFLVTIDRATPTGGMLRPAPPAVVLADGEATLAPGRGHIVVKETRVAVTYREVVLRADSLGVVPVAVKGEATAVNGNDVLFDLDAFQVAIRRPSIRLLPQAATAAAEVRLRSNPLPAANPFRNAPLVLKAASCALRPDGGIDGDGFHLNAATTCPLRPGDITLDLDPATDQSVHLPGAVELNGSARLSPGTPGGLTFVAKLTPPETSLVLSLAGPLSFAPEPEYTLVLKGGHIDYVFGSGGRLTSCKGRFSADLGLPAAVRDQGQQPVLLKGLDLLTDESGALFNAIDVRERIRAGFDPSGGSAGADAIFLIEPAPRAAFVYFGSWKGPTDAYASLAAGMSKRTPTCAALTAFLAQTAPPGAAASLFNPDGDARARNVFQRPGLSFLKGTLHLKAPQVELAPSDRLPLDPYFQLKTPFTGLLTATPWGITGTLRGSTCSFVPSAHPIGACQVSKARKQPTWEEILRFQEGNPTGRPPGIEERFRLSGVRILDMHAERIDLCMGALVPGSADITFLAHVPFPSYIDLPFRDLTLDASGRFHRALGPVLPAREDRCGSAAPGTLGSSAAQPQSAAKGQKPPVDVKLIPHTTILWAWRLPVTLVDQGVAVTFPGADPGVATIELLRKDAPDPGATLITSNELWLRPLYSANSSVKAGIRFNASLDVDGGFRLGGWDAQPCLGRLAPTPGKEKLMGFPCLLDGVTLADAGSGYNTEARAQDVAWKGRVSFPVFPATPAAFGMKKLNPFLAAGLQLACDKVPFCPPPAACGCADPRKLSLWIQDLAFNPRDCSFSTAGVFYLPPDPPAPPDQRTKALLVRFGSFLSAQVVKSAGVRTVELNTPMGLGETDARHQLVDCTDRTSAIDLTCYDADALAALAALGIPPGCCDDYVVGTYRVTRAGKTIVSSPNVKFYPNRTPFSLIFSGAEMSLTPEDDPNAQRQLLAIPGAELRITNGVLFGDFDTDALPVDILPNIRGECAFSLDVRNAYYAIVIGASFPVTPFPLNVEGEVFIYNAPMGQLGPVMARACAWALFPDATSMQMALGMNQPDTVVCSGLILSGNGAAVLDLGPVEAKVQRGAGLFIHRARIPDVPPVYNFGVFQNNRGAINLEFLSVEVVAVWAMDMAPDTTRGIANLDDVKRCFRNSGLTLSAVFSAKACVTCRLAYAQLAMPHLVAGYSVQDGFFVRSGWPEATVGLGGCP